MGFTRVIEDYVRRVVESVPLAYLRRRAGLSALLEDSVCCGASGNGFIRGLGAGRESPRLTPGLARYIFRGKIRIVDTTQYQV
jgi:hypothetical protein